MGNAFKWICMSAVIAFNVPSLADDSAAPSQGKSPKQLLQECMDRQRAANAALSKHDMKKACEQELHTAGPYDNLPQAPPALVPVPP